MDTTEHTTHVERNANGTYYFWCEGDDCYATGRYYEVEAEAFAAAEMHRENPG